MEQFDEVKFNYKNKKISFVKEEKLLDYTVESQNNHEENENSDKGKEIEQKYDDSGEVMTITENIQLDVTCQRIKQVGTVINKNEIINKSTGLSLRYPNAINKILL